MQMEKTWTPKEQGVVAPKWDMVQKNGRLDEVKLKLKLKETGLHIQPDSLTLVQYLINLVNYLVWYLIHLVKYCIEIEKK